MASYDFEVDMEALIEAAKGTEEAVKLFHDKDVADLVPTEDAIANDTLWDALDEFKDDWEEGINNMVEDIQSASSALGQVAENYYEFDKQGAQKFKKIADPQSLRM